MLILDNVLSINNFDTKPNTKSSPRGCFCCIWATRKVNFPDGPDTTKADVVGFHLFAEGKGFEPLVHCCTTVFKTAAIDHSANLPSFSVAKV